MSGIKEEVKLPCESLEEARETQEALRDEGIRSCIILRQHQYYVRYVQTLYTLHGADE